jgi:purine-binding chemotaxis protein CheW
MDIAKIRKKIRKDQEDTQQREKAGKDKSPGDAQETSQREAEDSAANKGTGSPPPADVKREKTRPAKEAPATRAKVAPEPKAEDVTLDEDSAGAGEIREEEEKIEILTFSLGKEEFAFKIFDLFEILRYQRITRVPKMPDYVIGITSLRGKIIPVVNLKQKLGLTQQSAGMDQRGKILIIKGPRGPVGAFVDRVIGVVRIPVQEILPPPSHLTEIELKYIEGVAVVDKRFIPIIHMKETVAIDFQ